MKTQLLGKTGLKVTPEDLAEIDAVAPRGAAAGSRYPESMMTLTSR